MPPSSSRREIYTIIAIGSLGFLGGLRRLIINRNGDPLPDPSTTAPSLAPLIDNQILTTDTLPQRCQDTLRIRDCIISTQSGDTSALSLYRQQITSERNIQSLSGLITQCDTQYAYLQSLSGSFPTSCR